MKRLIIILLLFISVKSFAQTAPVNPVQLTTNSIWYEPSTHNRWGYNGTTYSWYQLIDSVQLFRHIKAIYFNPRQFFNAGDVLHPISLIDSIPTQTGNAGKVLGTNGTSLLWVTGGGGTTYPLTNGIGINSFSFSGGTNGIQVIADTTFLKSKVGFNTDYNNLSGRITTNTANIATNTSNIATKAPLASPALTGVPTAPTATVGTNTNQLATTAFVLANGGSGATGANPTATAGTSAVNGSATTFMRSDGAPKIDSTVFRTTANSPTLAQLQTKYNTFVKYTDTATAFANYIPKFVNSTIPSIKTYSASQYFGSPTAYVAPTGNFYVFGDSITVGTGSTGGLSYVTDLGVLTGLTPVNFGVSASTLEKRSPINWGGGNNMIDEISSIPTYSAATTKYLIFLWGINDWQYVGANYTPTNYTADYTTVMNAVVAAGWPMSRVLITSLPYSDPSMFGTTGTGGGTRTQANKNLFSAAAQGVATSFGCLYTELDNFVSNRGGVINLNDQLHPNNMGHALYARAIANTIKTQVYANGQTAAFNGNTELLNVTLNSNNSLSDAGSNILGIDNVGKVGILGGLPTGTRVQNPILVGGITQGQITIRPTLSTTSDIMLQQGTQLVGNWDLIGDNTTWIKLVDGGANMIFGTTYNNANFQFFQNTTTHALFIDKYQRLIVGAGVPDGPAGSIDGQSHLGDVVLPISGALTGTAGSKGGRFEPVGVGNHAYIRENSAASSIIIATTGGTDYNQVNQINIWPKGEITSQAGGTFTYNAVARLSVNSTTQGVLIPRMTASQRDAMGYISVIGIGAAGTLYSSAPTVTISAPDIAGGTQATATATVSGGGLSSVVIVNAGTGYTKLPTVSLSGGGGSGGVVAVTAISLTGNTGLMAFNSTSNRINFFNGTSWRESNPVPTVSSQTANYTILLTDGTITADATGGAITQTLPTAVGCAGQVFLIKKIDASANTVTAATTSSQTIDGSTTYVLSTQYKYITVQSNNVNWIIIGNN